MNPVERTPARSQEVVGIRGRLHLQNAVHCRHQLDEVGHRAVALLGVKLGVLAPPFKLIEDCMLRLLLPMKQEDVLPQVR